MNIYLLEQDVVTGYDTYDEIVVVAENEDDARLITPAYSEWGGDSWVSREDIDKIQVTLIGVADVSQERGIVSASFNAG